MDVDILTAPEGAMIPTSRGPCPAPVMALTPTTSFIADSTALASPAMEISMRARPIAKKHTK